MGRGARVTRTITREAWQSTTPKGSAWRFDFENGLWIGNTGVASNAVIPSTTPAGAPYGTALTVEANPTALADVPAARRISLVPSRTGLPTSGGVIGLRIYGYGVTSGTFSYNGFIYDAFSGTWVQFATAVAGSFGASGLLTLTALTVTMNFYGALAYVAVNANAANAPYMAYCVN